MRQSLNERSTVSYEGPWESTLATEALALLDLAEAFSYRTHRPLTAFLADKP